MPRSTGAVPLVVTTFEGRPTKLAPNSLHPDNGGTDSFAQASVLDLYSPSRSRKAMKSGKPVALADVEAVLAGGVSERHFQPHQNDQAKLWAAGQRRAWWFDPVQAEAHAKAFGFNSVTLRSVELNSQDNAGAPMPVFRAERAGADGGESEQKQFCFHNSYLATATFDAAD